MTKYKIKLDPTSKPTKYYCVLQNPTVNHYETKVIYGSSPEIVERKIKRQLKKWGVESND